MVERETELEMVQRHVQRGAVHIARQYGIIAKFREMGISTALAENVLATLREVQIGHEAHLKRLTAIPAYKPSMLGWQHAQRAKHDKGTVTRKPD